MTMMLFNDRDLPQNKTGAVTKLSDAEIAARFEEFWSGFPKRKGNNPKFKAEQKFAKLVKSGESFETIIAGGRRFAAECERNRIVGTVYVPQTITWLNGKMWLNDPDAGQDQAETKSFADIARELRERAHHDQPSAAADSGPAGLLR